jgi:hypothetical protein
MNIIDAEAVSASAGTILTKAQTDDLSEKIRQKVQGIGRIQPLNPIVSTFASNGRLYLIHRNHPIKGGGVSQEPKIAIKNI